jgi:hypothetical protein
MADRVNSIRFKLTHALLAHTLGVRRQSISEVAGQLQTAGILSYRRGEVQILDRQKLEATACECYSEIKRCYDRWVRPIL